MRRALAAAIALTTLFAAPRALAQSTTSNPDPRFAVDRFQLSERGSDWFANESLDLRGSVRPNVGATLLYSYRSFVTVDGDGNVVRSPVRNLAVVQAGGNVVLVDHLRLSLELPFQIFADGRPGFASSMSIPAPKREQGIGDLRLGATVRIVGEYGGPFTLAVGFQVQVPTGQQSQYMSDGDATWRGRPRWMAAGEVVAPSNPIFGSIVWAAQTSIGWRGTGQVSGIGTGDSAPGSETLGPDFTMAGALGVRVLHRTVVLGPEVFMTTTFADAFKGKSTALEFVLGAHWLNADQFRVGAGIGRGVTEAIGSPAIRLFATAEWAPPAGKDSDGDGIIDERDACPRLYGRRRSNPKTNGCPPDRDGDGVYDPEDACINVPGVPSLDRNENGCPPDRDHDGVPDAVDACPDRRGPKSDDPLTNGCPADSDHDGVPDALDACRDVIGIPTNDPLTTGCPPDTDGDGIDDLNDACPNLAGQRSLEWQTNGCPDLDRDKDGVPNDLDACPDQAGTPDPLPRRNGCPKVYLRPNGNDRIEMREQIKWKTKTSAELGDGAVALLEAILHVIEGMPVRKNLILRIEAHTAADDGGLAATAAKKLTTDRAKVIEKWLVAHGIDASRLTSEGFGAEKPIDTNETEVGRANNRRVEIHVIDSQREP